MRISVFFVVILVFCSCEDCLEIWEPCENPSTPLESDLPIKPLYVSPECTEKDRESILIAVRRFNEMSSALVCKDTLEVVGTRSISQNDVWKNLKDTSTIQCYYTEPEFYQERFGHTTWDGYADKGKIVLFRFRKPKSEGKTLDALVMHEVGHYMGLGHSENPDDVMFPVVDNYDTHYGEGDGELFCEEFGC